MAPASIGRYRIVALVGQGAMGTVFRCRDESLERDVAVKVMAVAQGAEADARARFVREARAAARLQHPNIITIYELGEHHGTPFIAMEYLEGIDLQRAITAGIRPDPRVTLPIVLQILSGLEHAHEHGIVHRDIKPSNIFLPRGRPAKIMDFGVARLTSAVTTAGTIVGTPNYMSPEQVKGAGVDGRSDLFSTGLILYELVTGERAFTGGSVVAVLYKIANEQPDLSLLPREGEWECLRRVVTRALAQDPEQRYPDAQSMAVDLAQALQDLGGAPDWAGASDRGLLVRHTPQPMRRAEDAAAARVADGTTPPPTAVATRPTERHAPTKPQATTEPGPSRRRVLVGVTASALLVVAIATGALLALRRGARPASPPARPSPDAHAPSIEAPRTPAITAPVVAHVALPTPAPSASTAPSAAPAAGRPATGPAPATPTPARSAAGASPAGPSTPARLDRANALLEAGRYQSALNEARAVLAQQPNSEEARAIAEDASAALVVEEKLRSARAAVTRGDRAAAVAELQAGLAIAPNDARLLALYRQLAR